MLTMRPERCVAHHAARRRGEEGERGDVQRQRPVPELRRHGEERLDRAVAGVVDEDVEPAPFRHDGIDGGVCSPVTGQVVDDDHDLGARRLAKRLRLARPGLVDVEQGNAKAAGRKLERDVAAKTAAGSGDQGDFGWRGGHVLGLLGVETPAMLPLSSTTSSASRY